MWYRYTGANSMRILFEVGHPAQVHLIKNAVKELKSCHDVLVCAREKEGIVLRLLRTYDIPFVQLGRAESTVARKALSTPSKVLALMHVVGDFKPQIIFSTGSLYAGYAAKLFRVPHVMFVDSDSVGAENLQMVQVMPLASCVLAPTRLEQNWTRRFVHIDSYKELAYLHPHWFTPEFPQTWLGVNPGEPYVLLRFGAFKASHDLGIRGFSPRAKENLVEAVSKDAKVFISSESVLPESLRGNILQAPVEVMHHVIAFATLVVCDTQTTATEAACLGTPVIRHNGWIERGDLSNFRELQERGLLMNARSEDEAIGAAREWVQSPPKGKTTQARDKLLAEKIDLTAFLIWFLERWPTSLAELSADPSLQRQFVG